MVFFTKSIALNADLEKRIQSEEAVDAWVTIARDAGFEFTADEFVSVIGETLGKPVTAKSAVQEYRGAQRLMGALELSEPAQAALVGGGRRSWQHS